MKKKIAKQIGRIAGNLPVIMRNSCEKHIITGQQMIEQGREVTGVNNEPVIPDRVYIDRMPVQIAINHKRAMKKLYAQYGNSGIQSYLNAVNNHQQKQ